MAADKKIVIIAGPNGAGKTTFAQEFLPHEANCPVFVNADFIAEGLSPFQPGKEAFRAGRLMLQLIHEYVRRGENFAFETTLSGRVYARLIPRWRHSGFSVKLIFLSIGEEDQAVARVRFRVRQGGHDIPEPIIRRRYRTGLKNFGGVYKQIVDEWVLYDNSGFSPVLLATEQNVSDSIREPKVASPRDPDLAGALPALFRAAQRARETAWRTGTPLIIARGGRVVEEWVTEDPSKDKQTQS